MRSRQRAVKAISSQDSLLIIPTIAVPDVLRVPASMHSEHITVSVLPITVRTEKREDSVPRALVQLFSRTIPSAPSTVPDSTITVMVSSVPSIVPTITILLPQKVRARRQ